LFFQFASVTEGGNNVLEVASVRTTSVKETGGEYRLDEINVNSQDREFKFDIDSRKKSKVVLEYHTRLNPHVLLSLSAFPIENPQGISSLYYARL